ncbi:MAG: SRPBCC family protein [Ilumatobacteraceae bacterium]
MSNTPRDTPGDTPRDTLTVERLIAAPPSAIFDLLADPARHREIDGSGTVRDADAGSQRLTLGSTFGMAMQKGFGYRMINTVVEFEDDRVIAWQPRPAIKLLGLAIGGRIWKYELEPQAGGTLVKETWDIRQEKVPMMVRPMAKGAKRGMEATLERIERIVAK